MAYKKLIECDLSGPIGGNTGFSGDYVRYNELVPPSIERGRMSNAYIRFYVYKNQDARTAGKSPFKMLEYAIPPEALHGIALLGPIETMQWVYENAKRLIPDLADAEDILDV